MMSLNNNNKKYIYKTIVILISIIITITILYRDIWFRDYIRNPYSACIALFLCGSHFPHMYPRQTWIVVDAKTLQLFSLDLQYLCF